MATNPSVIPKHGSQACTQERQPEHPLLSHAPPLGDWPTVGYLLRYNPISTELTLVEPEDVELDERVMRRFGQYIQFEEVEFDVAGEIGKVLKQYGISHRDFADIAGLPRSSVGHWLSGRLPHRSVYRKIYRGIDLVHSHMLEKPRRSSDDVRMFALTALEEVSEPLQKEKPQLQDVRFDEMSFNVSCLNTEEARPEAIHS